MSWNVDTGGEVNSRRDVHFFSGTKDGSFPRCEGKQGLFYGISLTF
jgi:hypothetical protein